MNSIQLTLPFPPEIEWRDIPGYEGKYQASKNGLIKHRKKDKPLLPGNQSSGYHNVRLPVGGKFKSVLVHRLIMLAFVGERPAGMEINHKNGIRTDNRLENLEYITHSENILYSMHILKTMRSHPGMTSIQSKLTDDIVREIRQLYLLGGASYLSLSIKFNVSPSLIGYIVTRKRWQHIE